MLLMFGWHASCTVIRTGAMVLHISSRSSLTGIVLLPKLNCSSGGKDCAAALAALAAARMMAAAAFEPAAATV